MMLAIRHTFPNGQQLNGAKRSDSQGLVTAGASNPPQVAYWISLEEAEETAESMRLHNPGSTFEVVPHPDSK